MKFWKKGIAVVATVLLLLAVLSGCGSSEAFVWEEILLNEQLPAPFTNKGEVHSETDESLWMELHGVDSSEFNSYIKQCQEFGYTIDSKRSTITFDAYNQTGYKVSLYFIESSKELSVNLSAPMLMSDLDWPINTLCGLLPKPSAAQGNVKWDTDAHLLVYLANMNTEDFAEYADACAEAGFSLNASKGTESYFAKNADGYSLSLRYEGFNILAVEVKAPSSSTTTSKPSEDTSYRSDFKKAMDEYEAFIDEYIAFMERYKNSDGTDLSLLTDYAAYVSDYADMVEAFAEWESEDLNTAEALYYAEVQARVAKKLLESAL